MRFWMPMMAFKVVYESSRLVWNNPRPSHIYHWDLILNPKIMDLNHYKKGVSWEIFETRLIEKFRCWAASEVPFEIMIFEFSGKITLRSITVIQYRHFMSKICENPLENEFASDSFPSIIQAFQTSLEAFRLLPDTPLTHWMVPSGWRERLKIHEN